MRGLENGRNQNNLNSQNELLKSIHLAYICLNKAIMIRSFITNIILLFLCNAAIAQYKIELLDSSNFKLGEGVILSKTSFRGLSVVDNQTIWVSGSKGTIAKSHDGGKTFEFKQLKGYERSDFRDIEAFDDKRAIMLSSGTPAYILKTIDGGQTWKEVYKNLDTAYFLDAMDFWDETRGILVADPKHGHFVLLQTKDAGENWQELDTNHTPKAMEGEAVFAASGTSLRCTSDSIVAFVSGGTSSNFYYSKSNGLNWINKKSKIIQGQNSQGMFSFIFNSPENNMVGIGGDYLRDTIRMKNVIFWDVIKNKSHTSMNSITSYKSCFENLKFIHNEISCGTDGVEMLDYKKPYWYKVSSESFNVVRKAKKGNAVFLAGGKGRISRLVY